MKKTEYHEVMARIDRLESYSGFVCDDQNVRIAFQNFQEVLARAMKKYLKKADGDSDERMASIYLHEIEYLMESIESWAKFVK
tara:strand:- start:1664 stop:1912 length:249 start_codon:yes stop_codon:yes gene_type:complete